jgi:hypothetical protein
MKELSIELSFPLIQHCSVTISQVVNYSVLGYDAMSVETRHFRKKLGTTYKIIWQHNPEAQNRHFHHHENFRSHIGQVKHNLLVELAHVNDNSLE